MHGEGGTDGFVLVGDPATPVPVQIDEAGHEDRVAEVDDLVDRRRRRSLGTGADRVDAVTDDEDPAVRGGAAGIDDVGRRNRVRRASWPTDAPDATRRTRRTRRMRRTRRRSPVSLRNCTTPDNAATTMKTIPTTGCPIEIQAAPAAITSATSTMVLPTMSVSMGERGDRNRYQTTAANTGAPIMNRMPGTGNGHAM